MLKPDKFKKMLEEAKNDADRLNAYKWYLDQWIDRSRTMEHLLDDTERRFDMDDYMREEGWDEPCDEDEELEKRAIKSIKSSIGNIKAKFKEIKTEEGRVKAIELLKKLTEQM